MIIPPRASGSSLLAWMDREGTRVLAQGIRGGERTREREEREGAPGSAKRGVGTTWFPPYFYLKMSKDPHGHRASPEGRGGLKGRLWFSLQETSRATGRKNLPSAVDT